MNNYEKKQKITEENGNTKPFYILDCISRHLFFKKFIRLFFAFLNVWVTPNGSHDLFLIVCSVSTPGSAQRSIFDARDWTRLGYVQAYHLKPWIISVYPSVNFFGEKIAEYLLSSRAISMPK